MHIEIRVTELGSKDAGATATIDFGAPGGLVHRETVSGYVCIEAYRRVIEAPDGARITSIHTTGPLSLEITEHP
jgi:hypothetical protein